MQTTFGVILIVMCFASGLCQTSGSGSGAATGGSGDRGGYRGSQGGPGYPSRPYPNFNRNAIQSQKAALPLLYYYFFDNYVF